MTELNYRYRVWESGIPGKPWYVIDCAVGYKVLSCHKNLNLALEKTRKLNGSYTWRRRRSANVAVSA